MTGRMNKYQRSEIIGNIRAKLFVKERKALEVRESEFYHEVVDYSLGQHCEVVKSLPLKLVRTVEWYYPNFGGRCASFHFKKSRPGCAMNFSADHKLSKKFTKLENAKEDLDAKICEVITSAKAVIYSCTTFKKLLDTWPEVKEYVPEHFLLEHNVGLPAVQIEDVNKLLKLAVKK